MNMYICMYTYIYYVCSCIYMYMYMCMWHVHVCRWRVLSFLYWYSISLPVIRRQLLSQLRGPLTSSHPSRLPPVPRWLPPQRVRDTVNLDSLDLVCMSTWETMCILSGFGHYIVFSCIHLCTCIVWCQIFKMHVFHGFAHYFVGWICENNLHEHGMLPIHKNSCMV